MLAGFVAGSLFFVLVCIALLPVLSSSLLTVYVTFVSPPLVPAAITLVVLLCVLAVYSLSRFVFAAHLIVDQHAGPVRALRGSADLTRRNRGAALGLLLLLAMLNASGAALAGVGLVVTLPLSLLTLTAAYRQLVAAAEPASPESSAYRGGRMPASVGPSDEDF